MIERADEGEGSSHRDGAILFEGGPQLAQLLGVERDVLVAELDQPLAVGTKFIELDDSGNERLRTWLSEIGVAKNTLGPKVFSARGG